MQHAATNDTTTRTKPRVLRSRLARVAAALSLACLVGLGVAPGRTVACDGDGGERRDGKESREGGRDRSDGRDKGENRDKGDNREKGERGDGRERGGWWGPKPPTTQPDVPWVEVAGFMREHSPHKWKMFETMRDGQWKQNAARGI